MNPTQICKLSLVLFVIALTSCKNEKVKKRTATLYAYEVEVAADTYSAGVLRYMEAEYYEGNRLVSKTFYNNDQSVKGKEIYEYTDRDSLPEASKYYDGNGALLATYEFINKDGHQVQRNGFDGVSNELLRQERYQYDKKGNRVTKILFDSGNRKQRSFLFGHDKYGNETQMSILNGTDNVIAKEEYEIALIDDAYRWREKWGYLGKEKFPKTFYKKTYE